MIKRKMLFGMAVIVILGSCSPLLGLLPSKEAPSLTPVMQTGSFELSVDTGKEPRDVIFIFTGSTASSSEIQRPSVNGQFLPAPFTPELTVSIEHPSTRMEEITEFNRNPYEALGRTRSLALENSGGALSVPEPLADIVGDTASFTETGPTPSTCRAVVPAIDVATEGGTRTLNIWVADNCWTAASVPYKVNQAMVDALASVFLKAGPANDIFDWLTAITGSEWGATGVSDLIGFDREITILLADIEADSSPSGGVVGYFWAGNNFSAGVVPDSNERIMFVIDAVMFANPSANGSAVDDGSGWQPTDYWAKECFSTLAHEFQHMIQFYQKGIVARGDGSTSDVWINEMCSLIAEDLLADKIAVPGPRGVAYNDYTAGAPDNPEGRIPVYNYYTYLPLAITGSFGLESYSTSYAFGAFLARNGGGAGLLRDIVQNQYVNSQAVTTAYSKMTGLSTDFEALLKSWASAVIGSDVRNMPNGLRYNTGMSFDSSLEGIQYRLGSIDFFNYPSLNTANYSVYGSGPRLYGPSSPITALSASSAVYYLARSAQVGEITYSITLPEGVSMQIFLK